MKLNRKSTRRQRHRRPRIPANFTHEVKPLNRKYTPSTNASAALAPPITITHDAQPRVYNIENAIVSLELPVKNYPVHPKREAQGKTIDHGFLNDTWNDAQNGAWNSASLLPPPSSPDRKAETGRPTRQSKKKLRTRAQ